ncbi:hypothetical protein AX767_10860 [Variovorax sp. PAMC 28711]|nr:hypothetical protein AX767_10860 [Variovorax sp. PAMC 28711]
MFCIGCAGKLPAFAATGPSALQALGGASARPMARAASDTGAAPLGTATALPPRGLLIAVLLLGATVLALAAWIGFGPPRATTPGMASAAAPPLKTLPASAVATPSPAPAPASQVPVEAALATGESTVPATADAPALASTAPVPRIEAPQRAPQRSASVSQASASRGAADPRAGCEQLFFVLAARCEARHCDEAAYTRHPRCTLVRAQRQRDEARRNLTQ